LRHDLPALPEELLLARDRGQVLFIAGAGISRPHPSNLPDFRGLVAEVYKGVDATLASQVDAMLAFEKANPKITVSLSDYTKGLTPAQQAELRRFALGEYDNALGMLERRIELSPSNSSAMRREVVRIISSATKPNSLHTSLVTLGQRFGRPFIATTNFDRLLESAATRRRLQPSTFSLGAMPRPSRRSDFNGIFHVHGCLPAGGSTAADLVLTDQDFGDVYLRRRIAADFVYDAARIFSFVLVGYSLSDAPMRYLLNAIAGDETHFPDIRRRYAIIPTSGADPVVEADWRARGITPIAYDEAGNHSQGRLELAHRIMGNSTARRRDKILDRSLD
jgi:NAD-dependent SIR2 family protein deacetylase